MNYLVVKKGTNKQLNYEQRLVFQKLLAAYGPKRAGKHAAER